MTNTDCKKFAPTPGGCVPSTSVFWVRKPSDPSPKPVYLQTKCVGGLAVRSLTDDPSGLVPTVGYTEADKIATVQYPTRGGNCSDPVHVTVCTVPVGTPALSALACDGTTTINIQADPLAKQIVNAPGTALSVRMCGPTANLKIEFSETLLHSASTELALMRIREYNEDLGTWSLRYENLDGTPFVGVLPADLTVATAQVQVTETALLGCAEGKAFEQRTTSRFDGETGALDSTLTVWVSAGGPVLSAAPPGFVLGACPEVCTLAVPVGVIASWG